MTTPKLDAQKLRADFAVFEELTNGRPVAYLDSASSTQKPRQVLDAMRELRWAAEDQVIKRLVLETCEQQLAGSSDVVLDLLLDAALKTRL